MITAGPAEPVRAKGQRRDKRNSALKILTRAAQRNTRNFPFANTPRRPAASLAINPDRAPTERRTEPRINLMSAREFPPYIKKNSPPDDRLGDMPRDPTRTRVGYGKTLLVTMINKRFRIRSSKTIDKVHLRSRHKKGDQKVADHFVFAYRSEVRLRRISMLLHSLFEKRGLVKDRFAMSQTVPPSANRAFTPLGNAEMCVTVRAPRRGCRNCAFSRT